MQPSNILPSEIDRFDALAEQWWDNTGKYSALHKLNPVRLDFFLGQLAARWGLDLSGPKPLAGIKIADIGCGGGLISEPLARLGAELVAIDGSASTIRIAKQHAHECGLEIDYRCCLSHDLLATGAQFDAIFALELLEHVPDPEQLISECTEMLVDDGLLMLSTINRTGKSFFGAILMAEHILRWVPKGTHNWQKFISLAELEDMLKSAGMSPLLRAGFTYDLLEGQWKIDARRLDINYAIVSIKQ